MILSNDQKHTTTFGARAFVRKEETTPRRGGGRDNFLLPRELLFFLFCLNPAVKKNFCYWAFSEIFRRACVVLLFCDGLWSLQRFCVFKCFCSVCSVQFSFHQNNNFERIYYYYSYITEKGEKERERERRETLKNRFSVASSRKNQFNKTKKRSRDWENYTQTQKKRIVFCTQFGANF